jgi:hypothetical protein
MDPRLLGLSAFASFSLPASPRHSAHHPRARIGTVNGHAKLTESDIRSIRLDSREHRDIAKSFGVNPSVISRVKARKLWAHVKD